MSSERDPLAARLLAIHEDWHGRECDDPEHCMWCEDVRNAVVVLGGGPGETIAGGEAGGPNG